MLGLLQSIFFSALPPKCVIDARPRSISGRTSYSQARLAFHFLPQLIPEYCTTHGFGPPPSFLKNSSWPWQARLASGLIHTAVYALYITRSVMSHPKRVFGLGFPAPPHLTVFRQAIYINSLAHSSIGTPQLYK